MGEKEFGWYRTEGGAVIKMDHPLHEAIAQRVANKEIVRVVERGTKDGETIWVAWEAPEQEPDDDGEEPEDPKRAALHDELESTRATVADLQAALAAAAQDHDAVVAAKDERIAELERTLEEATAPPAEPKAKSKAKAD